jgi:hypothetical protein
MKVLSNRISILKKENVLSIVILPTTDNKKLMLMFVWLLAWTVCGVLVFVNYFKLTQQDAKLFIIVYLSFWAYYEFKIMRAYLWKKWGKEKLWVQDGILHYKKEMNGKGKIAEYQVDLISDLHVVDVDQKNFSDFINQSFWIKGGERLEFTHLAKKIRFGMQISDEEARAILQDLKAQMSLK